MRLWETSHCCTVTQWESLAKALMTVTAGGEFDDWDVHPKSTTK